MMYFQIKCSYCSVCFEGEVEEWLHLLNAHRKNMLELGRPSYAMVCPRCNAGKYDTHDELYEHIDAKHGGRV